MSYIPVSLGIAGIRRSETAYFSTPPPPKKTSYPISHLGLDEAESKSLKSCRIRTTEKLLEAAKNPKGRQRLAERTNINEARLLELANKADFLRLDGMGPKYIPLLRAVGVNTVRELKYRNPENLTHDMAAYNSHKKKLVRFLPGEKLVMWWVEQAKKLPLKITYR